MNLKELIKTRRTIHRFSDQPVAQNLVEDALSYVMYAPNHHATYPYRFYQLGPETKEKVFDYAHQRFMEKQASNAEKKIMRWRNIPGWLVATQKISKDSKEMKEDYATLSITLYILMLILHEQNIGSKWATTSLFSSREFYQLCQIDPQKEEIIGVLWFGYAAKTPEQLLKPNLTHYFHLRA